MNYDCLLIVVKITTNSFKSKYIFFNYEVKIKMTSGGEGII